MNTWAMAGVVAGARLRAGGGSQEQGAGRGGGRHGEQGEGAAGRHRISHVEQPNPSPSGRSRPGPDLLPSSRPGTARSGVACGTRTAARRGPAPAGAGAGPRRGCAAAGPGRPACAAAPVAGHRPGRRRARRPGRPALAAYVANMSSGSRQSAITVAPGRLVGVLQRVEAVEVLGGQRAAGAAGRTGSGRRRPGRRPRPSARSRASTTGG